MSALAILFAATCVLTNAADVTLAVHQSAKGAHFDLRGKAFPYVPDHACFLLTDATGSTRAELRGCCDPERLQSGDIVHASGMIAPDPSGIGIAICSQLVVEAHGNPPPVNITSLSEIKDGKYDNLPVKVQGAIKEVFRDDIDPSWYYLVLTDDDKSIYLTLHASYANLETVQKMTGAFVAVSGLCSPWDYGYRVTLGRLINLLNFKAIEVIRPAPSDPFDVPDVVTIRFPNPEDIPPLERRRLSGKVIAVWHGNRILVKGANGDIHTVELSGGPIPEYGTMIEAAGLLKTDLYRMNLSDAIWRRTDLATMKDDDVEEVHNILTDAKGSARIIPTVHGRTFRIRGTVQDRPYSDMQYALVTLKCDSETIPVDVNANRSVLDGISIGCVIEATGTCIVECDNWHSYSAFPHVTGITLVVRQPSDVKIVSYPPWWTPGRLVAMIGILIVVIIGIFLWNRMLRRIIEKRGRQLFKEQVARIGSELRIDERTRLAIELHDSIAQNLTGVALEINAANRTADTDLAKAHEHLNIASTSLKSCRNELRYCLWDLRNSALEKPNMDDAILQTLAPHLGDTTLHTRFNVPRERISDKTAHAIMRIVRELSVNAVRHGAATSIWVAGSIDGDKLLFSVRDNGSGFDPESCPGAAQGHFGLTGIRERVDVFEGEMKIDSEIGRGSKITIMLNIPQEKEKD
jgi:signal transduction histidine kinase